MLELFSLKDRVAVITGSASGIGRATARLFAEAGASVVLASRRPDKLQAVADEIIASGGHALVAQTDVTVEAQVKHLVERSLERFGRIDVLVNNAGILTRTPVPDTTEDEWYALVDTNLKGPFLCCKHVLPVMLKQGRGNIVNIASYLGQFAGSGNTPVYSATKGGLIALTRALAVKYGPQQIRTNAIAPAFIKTDLNRNIIESAPDPVAKEREIAAPYPLKRIGKPEDVAAAALYFASDASNWVTSAVLLVDGGLTAA
jgi:NAD(P)-dependent dehydrogenase (short-subunit alcohol dehydrogenase family)